MAVASVYDYLARRAAMLLLVCCPAPIRVHPSHAFPSVSFNGIVSRALHLHLLVLPVHTPLQLCVLRGEELIEQVAC